MTLGHFQDYLKVKLRRVFFLTLTWAASSDAIGDDRWFPVAVRRVPLVATSPGVR